MNHRHHKNKTKQKKTKRERVRHPQIAGNELLIHLNRKQYQQEVKFERATRFGMISARGGIKRRLRPRTRQFAVYAVGEGWTGALGIGNFQEDVPGHYDDEEDFTTLKPMYTGPVHSVATGWGHTAVLTQDRELLLTGRPHDFSALLRLKRLPKMIRDYSVRQTVESTVLDSPKMKTESRGIDLFNPTELVGSLVSWLSDSLSPDTKAWEAARSQSILSTLTAMEAAEGNVHQPVAVACSAGFSAFITKEGHLYAFGLNSYGQCGSGYTVNNLWHPTRVTGLSSDFAEGPRAQMDQSFPIMQVELGLQHAICLNSEGEVFCWGKGERGQLGQEVIMGESHTALPVKKAFSFAGQQDVVAAFVGNSKPVYERIGKVRQVAAGMIHSAALTDDNRVLIWGKHVLPAFGDDVGKKIASDATLPYILHGLPSSLRVEKIACGSHHTAMLLEDGSVWAVGVASDDKVPIHIPVQLVPAGVIEIPVRQFAAHMDRTTIVGNSGRAVHQVHLWKDPEIQEYAMFTPPWLDQLLLQDGDMAIREVHRSWVHSVVVTDP